MSLSIINLNIATHNGSVLLSDCSFLIQKGEILSVMGPSGCGKSTLLNIIAGHVTEHFTYTGDIQINGSSVQHLAPYKRKIGILFQEDLLFPHLCIWENLAFALPNNVKGAERKKQALKALADIHLQDLSDHYPEQISGGQRARISLVRMLLAKPDIALLDEPFSKLDNKLRMQFRDWVFNQLAKANIPTLLVTHDVDDIPNNSQQLLWPTKDLSHA